MKPTALGGKVYLSVSATNNQAGPVDMAIATAYGNKTFKGVASGEGGQRLDQFAAHLDSLARRGHQSPRLERPVRPVSEAKAAPYEAFPAA